jgi:hypothetical protein
LYRKYTTIRVFSDAQYYVNYSRSRRDWPYNTSGRSKPSVEISPCAKYYVNCGAS